MLIEGAVYRGWRTSNARRRREVNAANEAGHTAVMRAMLDVAQIKLLVENGANINAANLEGRPPLMLASAINTLDS